MKKAITLVCTALSLGAFSQAPKYVLMEHFTQAGCGPCAQQNPGFETNILDKNPTKVRHVAYHVSWPGTDPMYNYNKAQIDSITSYYQPSGVPKVYMMGTVKSAGPSSFTQTDVNNNYSATGSPIKIEVTQVDNGTTRDVTVKITSVGTPPSGDHYMRAMIVERPVDYSSPPGSNGETHFPNVFRKFLTSVKGVTMQLPAKGSSVTYNYTFTEDAKWKAPNIAVMAYVINKTTKVAVNAGSTYDSPLGVDNLEMENIALSIYPNPANERVYVNWTGIKNVSEVSIYDVLGQMVKNIKVTGTSLDADLSGMEAGIYFVRIAANNGQQVLTQKLQIIK